MFNGIYRHKITHMYAFYVHLSLDLHYEVEVACVISTPSDVAVPVDESGKEHMPKAGVLLHIAAWAYG